MVEVELGGPVECLDRADGRSEETQLEERRDKAAWAGGVEEDKGNDETEVGTVCKDGGEDAPLRRGGSGVRAVTGDWEGILGVQTGNLGGGEENLTSVSIKSPDCETDSTEGSDDSTKVT